MIRYLCILSHVGQGSALLKHSIQGWNDNIVNRVLALHVVDSGSILGSG